MAALPRGLNKTEESKIRVKALELSWEILGHQVVGSDAEWLALCELAYEALKAEGKL